MSAIRFIETSRIVCCKSGATSIEYALIASLIAVVIIGAVTGLGEAIVGLFTTVGNAVG